MTIFEFNRRFPTEESAIDFIIETKYKGSYYCPKCGCVHEGIYHQQYDHRKMYAITASLSSLPLKEPSLRTLILTFVCGSALSILLVLHERVFLLVSCRESWV